MVTRMLPELHRQRYQEFQQFLEQLQTLISQPEFDRATLKSNIPVLQNFFQEQIKSLGLEALEAKEAHRSQSYQVEMDKQLRLLIMDGMFLQAARQSATSQQRLEQVSDRLKTLISYCQALLGADE
jgi:hypothetical protein